MRKYGTLFFDHRFFIIIITVCVAVLGINVWSSGPQQKLNEMTSLDNIRRDFKAENLKLKNLTKALNIVNVSRISTAQIQVSLRNDYDKPVTGYEVSVGSSRIQTELVLSGDTFNFIPPGGGREEIYAIQEDLPSRGLTILAVVFDDGTTDGQNEAIREIKDYRKGIVTERKNVLSFLQNIARLPDSEVSESLNRLNSELLIPPGDDKKKGLDNARLGRMDERRRIIRELHDLIDEQHLKLRDTGAKELTIGRRERLVNLVNYYKNVINMADR